MLDGVTDAVEAIADLLERASALNSGNSPAAGPTGAGSAGSGAAGGSGSGDPPTNRRRRPGPDDPEHDLLDDLINLHDPVLQDNVDHLVDLVDDLSNQGPRRARPFRDHLRNLFTTRTRPRFPGNPTGQLLSEEGAAFQEGAARYLDRHANISENLATSEFDYQAFEDQRQAGPYSRRRETAVERGGDTTANRFKDWFWGRSSSDGGGAGE